MEAESPSIFNKCGDEIWSVEGGSHRERMWSSETDSTAVTMPSKGCSNQHPWKNNAPAEIINILQGFRSHEDVALGDMG